jgi:protein-tyrosine phosphatase
MVTLLEDHEFELLGVTSLREEVEALGMRWWHLPIRDMATPDAGFEIRWRRTGQELRSLLGDGHSIALHCRGGMGRTGTIAARLLVELGSAPALAIERVRAARVRRRWPSSACAQRDQDRLRPGRRRNSCTTAARLMGTGNWGHSSIAKPLNVPIQGFSY